MRRYRGAAPLYRAVVHDVGLRAPGRLCVEHHLTQTAGSVRRVSPLGVLACLGGVKLKDLSRAKWSYVTRRVADRCGCHVGRVSADPRSGDLVVARVLELGAHDGLEDNHGRRVRLYPGDLVVGAYGNRYATDFYEGYVAA